MTQIKNEQDFFRLCCERVGRAGEVRERPRDIINEPGFPIAPKRAWYWLEKWISKGWYDYGITLDLGWMTDKEIEHLKEIS